MKYEVKVETGYRTHLVMQFDSLDRMQTFIMLLLMNNAEVDDDGRKMPIEISINEIKED